MSTRVDDIRRRFGDFAEAYPQLPLYNAICSQAITDEVACELLLAARPGQERPVLLLAALHELVLQPDPGVAQREAGRWFASVVGREHLPPKAEWSAPGPWPDIRRLITEHHEELRHTIATRTMQTNEVNRSTYLLSMLGLLGVEAPVALVEFGTSAGLLLTPDHYDVQIEGAEGRVRWGDPASACRPRGQQRDGHVRLGELRLLPIVSRLGADLATIDPDDEGTLRWLQACLWPDVPDRVERFVAAVRQRRAMPVDQRPVLIDADLTDPVRVQAVLDRAVREANEPDPHVVVFTSWTLTYVERSRRAGFASVLAEFAASTGLTVTWLSAEPAGGVPGLPSVQVVTNNEGTAQLGAQTWRGGADPVVRSLGTADPHGRWLDLG
ncbi:DUF2332 domain-containing protein [Enemella sp. A6]|uniref:DUF2332 domain-containing protein n=1 Tax=Enemella sp. A6 TaxID=3440152 RepID=UPI003EBF79F2